MLNVSNTSTAKYYNLTNINSIKNNIISCQNILCNSNNIRCNECLFNSSKYKLDFFKKTNRIKSNDTMYQIKVLYNDIGVKIINCNERHLIQLEKRLLNSKSYPVNFYAVFKTNDNGDLELIYS